MLEPVAAIVVAAGSGSRLGGEAPKALRLLGGVALVRRSVDALAGGGVGFAQVLIPNGLDAEFAAVLRGARIPWALAPGGGSRQQSVERGLTELTNHSTLPEIVLVHDAARPLVPADVVERVITAVRAGASAVVPSVPVIDTIRQTDAGSSTQLDRTRLRAIQTPQGFPWGVLATAYRQTGSTGEFTDDAGVCEAAGYPVCLVEGSPLSLKITTPLDVVIAEQLLQQGKS